MDEDVTRLLLAQIETLTAAVKALKGETVVAPPRKTVAQLYALYESTWASQSWAPQMRATLKAGLAYFGDREADALTRADWMHWRDNVRAKENTYRKDADGNHTLITTYTLNLEFKRWRAVYRFGTSEGHVLTNPLVDVKAKRGAKKNRHTRPEQADLRALRPHCSALIWAFALLIARAGMRPSEARKLEWRRIDLKRSLLKVEWHTSKNKRNKLVPLTPDLVDALMAIKPDVGGRYVFQSPVTDVPYVASTLWMQLRAAIDKANLAAAEGDRRVVPMDFRHFFTSWAAEFMELPVVAAIRGDADLRSMTPYIQVTERQIMKAQRDMAAQVEQEKLPDATVSDGGLRSESTEIPPRNEKSR